MPKIFCKKETPTLFISPPNNISWASYEQTASHLNNLRIESFILKLKKQDMVFSAFMWCTIILSIQCLRAYNANSASPSIPLTPQKKTHHLVLRLIEGSHCIYIENSQGLNGTKSKKKINKLHWTLNKSSRSACLKKKITRNIKSMVKKKITRNVQNQMTQDTSWAILITCEFASFEDTHDMLLDE